MMNTLFKVSYKERMIKMKLLGVEKGMLMNFSLELAKINHKNDMSVDCAYLMEQLKIAVDFKKKSEEYLDKQYVEKISL